MSNWWGQTRPDSPNPDQASAQEAPSPEPIIADAVSGQIDDAPAEAVPTDDTADANDQAPTNVQAPADDQVLVHDQGAAVDDDGDELADEFVDDGGPPEADPRSPWWSKPADLGPGDLPTMAHLEALSSELDAIDAALAAMDADQALPARS